MARATEAGGRGRGQKGWERRLSAYWIGAFIGAGFFGFAWSRLWLWLLDRFAKTLRPRFVIAYALAWATVIPLAAVGFADGGPLNWTRSILTYTPALAFWLVVDLILRRKGAT